MMGVSETLQELARQVRRDTLRYLHLADPAWLTYAPPGTSNHLLWHAGHALWLQDVLCIRLLTGRSELPTGWEQTFGMDCRPLWQTTSWPRREMIVKLLEQQLSRIVQVLQTTSAERFSQTCDRSLGPATFADRIIHGFHDEAKHGGEMYLLLKLCRGGQLPDNP